MTNNTATKALKTFEYDFQGAHYTFTGTALEVANLKKMITAFESKMVENVLPKSVKRGRGRPAGAPKEPSEAQKIRTWASENGFTVGERGRLNKDVVEAYKAATV